MLRKPNHLISLGFGAGLLPWIPGTAGALIALPLYWLIMQKTLTVQILIVITLATIGIFTCGQTTRHLGKQDHQAIVWDETIGAIIVLMAVPATLMWWSAAIIMFRLFDIVKPWPIKFIDHYFDGGAAIMADDIVAAFMSCSILLTARWGFF